MLSLQYSQILLLALSPLLVFSAPAPAPEPSKLPGMSGLHPIRIDCGKGQGLPNISNPDFDDLKKAASRLAEKGGTCSTNPGKGKCIRVACDNTTGIYMCNADDNDGPNHVSCVDVASFAWRGYEGPGDNAVDDLVSSCFVRGFYAIHVVSGRAYSPDGKWTVVSGYANCNHSPDNQPDHE